MTIDSPATSVVVPITRVAGINIKYSWTGYIYVSTTTALLQLRNVAAPATQIIVPNAARQCSWCNFIFSCINFTVFECISREKRNKRKLVLNARNFLDPTLRIIF